MDNMGTCAAGSLWRCSRPARFLIELMRMDERNHNSADNSSRLELPDSDDIEAVAAFYERTGAMPISSIGPPIDRPIIPSRRPERVGDFDFTTRTSATPSAPGPEEAEDSEGENIRQEFLDMLNKELKGL